MIKKIGMTKPWKDEMHDKKPVFIKEVDSKTRNATISQQAFVGMVTNALEVYKKETFGVLLGTIHKKHYYVADTIAYQTARRDYEMVDITAFHINRINFALKHLTNQQVIGDYHSHPQGPDKLSATDVADLLRGLPALTCLISVYKEKSCQRWMVDKDYSICGSLGSKFFIRIMAYQVNHGGSELFRIKIVCPYIRRINKLKLYKEPLC